MKKLLMLALLCAAVCAGRGALAEAVLAEAWDSYHYYHGSEACAIARTELRKMSGAEARAAGKSPCPVCVPDDTAYPGIESVHRGGTVVVRVPDAWMAARRAAAAEPAALEERLLHVEDRQDLDVARLVHGRQYLDCLTWTTAGFMQEEDVLIPDPTVGDGAILMSQRHLGAAWYLVLRPSDADRKRLSGGGGLAFDLQFIAGTVEVRGWPAGVTLAAADGARRWTGRVELSPKASGGEVIHRDDDVGASGFAMYVVRDREVNTCVIREKGSNAAAPHRWLKIEGSVVELNGYRDGKDAVYCCVLTDAEVASLKEKTYADLYHVPLAAADVTDPAAGDPGRAPAASAERADGTTAEMLPAEYPVGTPFVAYVLDRPRGGIAGCGADVTLERCTEDGWRPAGRTKARADGEPGRDHAVWFCAAQPMVVPMDGIGALEEGLYRLRVSDDWDDSPLLLEFRVRDGAAQPAMPEAVSAPAPYELPVHLPPCALPGYESCLDATRRYESSTRSRLLAGETVYELRGIDERWGWGIGSHYSLFCYPEGRPEQARRLIADFDHPDVTMYDIGDGLLLWSIGESRLFRCDYGGGSLRELSTGLDAEIDRIHDVLPMGNDLYIETTSGVWRAGTDCAAPERVYTATTRMDNDAQGGGMLVCAAGRLFAADGGIVAIDTTRRDADGRMPALRLTDAYDREDGSCGLGYLAMGGRLYCWSQAWGATVSMNYDGSDLREVSKERFWFSQAGEGGIVLALTGKNDSGLFGGYDAAAFYLPDDPANPAFDPDHCRKRAIQPETYEFLLGNRLYRRNENGEETSLPLDPLGA